MSTSPFASRNLVRKRIIQRNSNYTLLRAFHISGTLASVSLIPLFIAVFLGVISVWSIAVAIIVIFISLMLYTRYWFKMLDNMKTSSRDHKFFRKMVNEEYW